MAPKEYAFNPLQATKEVEIGNYYFKKKNYRAAAKNVLARRLRGWRAARTRGSGFGHSRQGVTLQIITAPAVSAGSGALVWRWLCTHDLFSDLLTPCFLKHHLIYTREVVYLDPANAIRSCVRRGNLARP